MMTRSHIKQTLIDSGVSHVSGALLDALSATPQAGDELAREQVARIIESALERHGVKHSAIEGTLDDAEAILTALTASGNDVLLREIRGDLESAARVPLADPCILVELQSLCERAGYGNVMSSASALWRERLGDLAGGEFVAGPCRATVERAIDRIDAALSTTPTMSAEDMREAAAILAENWNGETRDGDTFMIATAIRSLPLTKEPTP